MSKNLLIFGALGILFLVVFLFFSNSKSESKNSSEGEKSKKEIISKSAEKVQVFVFHSNDRCYSCVTMGKYVKATVEEFFQSELRDGRVEFQEINVDLPENKEIAQKFKATGSSIFINAIIDGADNIKEEMQPWRLLSNKQSFSDYLTKKVKEKLE